MTAQQHLSTFNVTMDQAKSFIMSNLNNLQVIFDTCKSYGVNNDMIAEIYGQGVTGNNVASFFNANGFKGSELGFSTAQTTGALTYNTDKMQFVNTGSSAVTITDIGWDMRSSLTTAGTTSITTSIGTLEKGFTTTANGYSYSTPGMNLPDYTIDANSYFPYALSGTDSYDIPGVDGNITYKYTFITSVGNISYDYAVNV